METTTTERGAKVPSTRGRPEAGGLDLDALARLDARALGDLYAKAGRPTSVDGLAGRPRGRMLAVRTLDGRRRGRTIRGLAAARWFPWGGKSFTGNGVAGRGSNRVHFGGRHELFPFHTSIRPSVIDGQPCVMLDYDLPDNPGFIRAIHDEVREVEPGLYLGPAMWKAQDGPVLVLWFALDTREQAVAVGEK